MLIEVDGKRYPVKGIEDLTLKHIAKIQHELRSGEYDGITSLRTLDDIQVMFATYGFLSKAEQRDHPESLFLTCFTVWAARAMAGEDVTLMDAIDVPMSSIRTILEPSDRADESPKAKAPASGGAGQPGKRKKPR